MEDNNAMPLLVKKPKLREKKLKYHVFFLILSILLFGFLFALMKFGEDIMPFALFVLFFSIPVIILFSKHLHELVPRRVAKLLTEDVKEVNKKETKTNFFSTKGRLSNRNKQYALLVFLIIMGITIIQLIRDLFTRVDPLSVAKADRRTTLKLIVVTVLTIFSCVITQNFYEISSNFH